MPNSSGVNGHQNGTRPADVWLQEILQQYAHRNLSLKQRLQYLQEKEGYKISMTTLKKLNRQFQIPTVNKPPPLPVATTSVTKAVSADIAAQNGPSTIQQNLRLEHNIFIPRDTVQSIMRDNFPHGAETRFPGKRIPRPRGLLHLGDGVFQEVHDDGHEKMNWKALRMGSASIGIYGLRDHSSGKILFEIVVPNARCSSTVRHIYLDFVEKYGMICQQLTVDGGSETGEMYACHTALREKYAADLERPAFVALPSTLNIVIEGSWGHWLKFKGKTIRSAIELGKEQGYFQPGSDLHLNLFNWIWPKIVQLGVNEFVHYWNNHKTRTQQAANIPSGVAPNVIFDFLS
ncbi:uncharacterized protein C8R40DRAFT_1163319 [Lentinula edodes]|uniref:uncharacterized protein n=1 Tax=Lentinula edodes TaxID=5353 RepID=UPI001E8EDDE3|nr:uncharacterized protein C8R40DRAFT_1163319 [Lentinula edodes]KAH7870035.1 hypothetical protein C8R40DRAFT_1163319 [Lentinula edodes]